MKKLALTACTVAGTFAFVASVTAGEIIPVQPPSVPESGSTFAFLGVALASLAWLRQKLTK